MIERFLLVSAFYHTRSRHSTIFLKEKEIKYDVMVIIDKGQAGSIKFLRPQDLRQGKIVREKKNNSNNTRFFMFKYTSNAHNTIQ